VFVCALLFDEELARRLIELRLLLAEAGGDAIAVPPHITLVAAEELDIAAIETRLASVAASTTRFSIQFPAVGSFPGLENVVFLSPTPTESLLRLQQAIHGSFLLAQGQPVRWYAPGGWFPHCSLGVNLAELAAGLSIVRGAMGDEYSGVANRLVLANTPDPTPIFEFELSGGSHEL
jgi:2'-5' RNA ligase